MLRYLNACEQIKHIAQAVLVQIRPGKALGQNVLEALVFFLDAAHGLIDGCANLRGVRCGSDSLPAGVFRCKEDVLGGVFVFVLLKDDSQFHQFLTLGLKSVGKVFEEEQT